VKVNVAALTAERFADVETIFNARGCSVARGCWCMFYRRSGQSAESLAPRDRAKRAHAELKRLAQGEVPPGLVGYQGRVPVGWISLGPREDFSKLKHSRVMKPVDDMDVWSIVCFVVPKEFRGQGVATGLLAGAIAYAKRRGVTTFEAYPRDLGERCADDSLWFGAKSMYDAAGFTEVARRTPTRPVMRLPLR